MNLNIGDRVTWTSQAAGVNRDKNGHVVDVVQPGGRPSMDHHLHYPGGPRDHVSYIIEARRSDGARRRYWPKVSKLQKVEVTQ